MKYARLTKEQFEALQEEFTRFLATQKITAEEWTKLKAEKPEVAEAELDIFSDLVWEGALKAAQYLENASTDQLFSFAMLDTHMELIYVKVTNSEVDLTTTAGRSWLLENLRHESVAIKTGSKSFSPHRNTDKFQLVQQGSSIVDGKFHAALNDLIKP